MRIKHRNQRVGWGKHPEIHNDNNNDDDDDDAANIEHTEKDTYNLNEAACGRGGSRNHKNKICTDKTHPLTHKKTQKTLIRQNRSIPRQDPVIHVLKKMTPRDEIDNNIPRVPHTLSLELIRLGNGELELLSRDRMLETKSHRPAKPMRVQSMARK